MSKDIPMVDVSHLSVFDADGALAEAADRVNHYNRRGFLRGASAAAGGGLLFGVLPAAALGATPKGDVAILNFALTLEYLEAAFYKKALDDGALSGQLQRFATTVSAHEDAHVEALKKTLGSEAVKRPSFDFKGTTGSVSTFQSTAMVLEDTGVAAYQGQAPNIKSDAVLKAAASILPIEARHAAWIRSIASKGSGSPSPAPDVFNPAQTMDQVLAAVGATGFITNTAGAAPASPVSGQPNVAG